MRRWWLNSDPKTQHMKLCCIIDGCRGLIIHNAKLCSLHIHPMIQKVTCAAKYLCIHGKISVSQFRLTVKWYKEYWRSWKADQQLIHSQALLNYCTTHWKEGNLERILQHVVLYCSSLLHMNMCLECGISVCISSCFCR